MGDIEQTSVLIGNGLGRAINNDLFSLSTAYKKVTDTWPKIITPDFQETLKSFGLYEGFSEDNLTEMQRLVWSCQNLKKG